MVFNSLIKYRSNQATYRYLVSAPDADTMDEWWREVSANKNLDYQRLAPDFYSHTKGNCYDAAPNFKHRLTFTLLYDLGGRYFPIVHDQGRTDMVSGGSFFIRSKSDPSLYWYADENGGQVYASKNGRTKFRIRINGEDDANRTVMIGKDSITISSASSPKLLVGTRGGVLYLGADAGALTFGDLKKSLLAEGVIAASNGYSVKIQKVESGAGDEWELVR